MRAGGSEPAPRHGAGGATPVIAVVGPTASGKSELALDLAERLAGALGQPVAQTVEIVNADAFQLYRGMDIGTAKVPPNQRRGIDHHQLDVLAITEEASVAAYQHHARADIAAIRARGALPLLVGGSGLYVRAVLDTVRFPGTDASLRASIYARLDEVGPAELHRELTHRDPVAGRKIASGNSRRIVRALEVIELTGHRFSDYEQNLRYHQPALQLGIATDRETLAARIEQRTATMLDAGLVEETAGLLDAGLTPGTTAWKAIGYPQAAGVVRGELTRNQAADQITAATRKLVKKQQTWFNKDSRITWLNPAETAGTPRALADIAMAVVRPKLES